MKIEVNNIELNYIKEGSGRPVILLHGNGEDHHIFDELIIKLKEHFTIYAVDSRNHGESSKTDDYSYETMAEDIYFFIKKLNLTDVSLVGFSDGAILGMLLSLEHPLLFSKMALLGINLKPTDFKEDIYNYLVEEYQKTKDPLLKMMLEQPNIELSQLSEISTPSLVVAGEDDLFYEKSFEDIAKTLPNGKLKVIQGHDHGSYIINQDILYPDLIEFLQ
jgi:pimeloyl-ACP methyl ester carboxylesterase